MERSCLKMEKTIRANDDNDLKFMTGELEEKKKKKKGENGEEPYTESADDGPLEYFTE